MTLLVESYTRLTFGLVGMATGPRLSILTFHRVHPLSDTIFPDEPDAAYFDRLMNFVARSFNVMTLGNAASRLAQGNLPSRALVITFDDGYADNADVALPILQRHGLTATFFVSTGFLDGGRMWNDSVIECVRACRQPEIDLEPFGLGRCPLADAKERRNAIAQLLPSIKYLSLVEREKAIGTLQRVCGVTDLPTSLMMSTKQVQEMHRAGMEIGAHTVHHPILTTLSASEAEFEISEGRNKLQSIIDAPVDIFAYPNGKPGRDYDDTHVLLLKKLGFRCAVSTASGVGRPGDDLYQLPRFTPWDDSLLAWTTRLLLNQRNTQFDIAPKCCRT